MSVAVRVVAACAVLAALAPAGALASDPAGTIYVSDLQAADGQGAVDVFAAGANGNVAPIRQITGAATRLGGPGDVKLDGAGHVWVANESSSTVTEYAAGAGGTGATANVAPIDTISGSNTKLCAPDDMSVAPDGTIYVGNHNGCGGPSVVVFAPGASGNAIPERTLTDNSVYVDGVGVDATGTLYVDNTEGSPADIQVFAPGASGSATPERTIPVAGATDAIVGFSGQLFITTATVQNGLTNSVQVFAPGASTPSQNITSATGLFYPDDLAVSPNGTMYVTNIQTPFTSAPGDVVVYPPGATGNVPPSATIAGSNTALVNPEGVALEPPPVPTLTTGPVPSTLQLGQQGNDEASITGNNPTGSLVWNLYGPSDPNCTKAPAFTSSPTTVTGNGTYPSQAFTPSAVGSYSWVAEYSGDDNNAPATGACGDPSEALTVSQAATTLTVTPAGAGDFADPYYVSATLTNNLTSTGVSDKSVTLTLNSTDTCTATTDVSGEATCAITPSEPAGSYTLAGSFAGDTGLAASSDSAGFTVTHEETAITYTGATAATDGASITLSGTLTTDDPLAGAPVVDRTVTFTLGSGGSAQTCTGTTASDGTASCDIGPVAQPAGSIPVSAAFAGDGFYRPASTPSDATGPSITVSQASTSVSVDPQSGDFADATTVSATLSATTAASVSGQQLTFTLNGAETCVGTTDVGGVASCSITPGEQAGGYTLAVSFGGSDQLSGSDASANFTVNHEETALSYTGGTAASNETALTLSGTLTTDDPASGTGLGGESVTFTLGSGGTAQTCTGTTAPDGTVSCTIDSVNQPIGSVPVSAAFNGDSYYLPSSTTGAGNGPTVTITGAPTSLDVGNGSGGSGDFGDATTVSATLTDKATGSPISDEQLTFTLNGAETCTETTDVNGVASCQITPAEQAGTYTLVVSYGGSSTHTGSTASESFTVNHEQTALAYTGATTATYGSPITLSGRLTTDDPAAGTGLGSKSVTFTLGSGGSAQTCTGTTASDGAVSCTINSVSQAAGSVPVSAAFAGDDYYQPASTPGGAAGSTVTITGIPTSIQVASASADFADATTVSATLTNQSSGAAVSDQQLEFTLNGTESCTATTDGNGHASCQITPGEQAGSYNLAVSFAASGSLAGSSGSGSFTVNHEETAIAYTGPTSGTGGQPITLSGKLTTDDPAASTGLGGKSITFTLGSGAGAQTCSATTAAAGTASCTITMISQPPGTVPLSVTFAGNSYYVPASTPSGTGAPTITVANPTGNGEFLIGNISAGTPTVGNKVYFWGSQWASMNQFAGPFFAPPSLKGFVSGPKPITCGSSWSTGTGASPMPPATIPSVIYVAVTSQASKVGSSIVGNVTHVVAVKVNPGYQNNPQFPGTGTISATVC
jgi:sugar lactone lactonase YvrE